MSLPPSRRSSIRDSISNHSFAPTPRNTPSGFRPSEIALAAGSLAGLIVMIGLQISMWHNEDLGELNFLKTSNGWGVCCEWAAGATLGALTGYASFQGIQAIRNRCLRPPVPAILEEALLEQGSESPPPYSEGNTRLPSTPLPQQRHENEPEDFKYPMNKSEIQVFISESTNQ